MPSYDDKLLNGGGLSHLASTIKSELADKQDELVSGTNIKTINNNSLLGSGNLAITADDPSVAVSTTEPTGNEVVWINPNGSADTLATVATTGDYNDLTNKLVAGTNITIVTDSEGHNTISSTGGGSSYTAGTGIDITNDVISVDNTVAMKSDIPAPELPTITSGDAGKVLTVNSGETGVEWAEGGGGGGSYTFTNGLTESSGTVSWDLNDYIKKITYDSNPAFLVQGLNADGAPAQLLVGNYNSFGNKSSILFNAYGQNYNHASITGQNDNITFGHEKSIRSSRLVFNRDSSTTQTYLYPYWTDYNSSCLADLGRTADNTRWNNLYLKGDIDMYGNITANNIPAPPSTDGTYNLQCTVTNGVATYSWVAV